MKLEKLEELEHKFFEVYPEGFDDPEIIKIAKKHNTPKMRQFVKESFQKENFDNSEFIINHMIKTITKSSLVSVFEKVKFKDFALLLGPQKKERLAEGLKNFLYGDEEEGFNEMLNILTEGRVAKWPIISVFKLYLNPEIDVLIKPTTVKSILKHLEVTDFAYNPRPSYEFYVNFRNLVNTIKLNISDNLASTNGAVTGFLMLTIPKK